MSADPRLAAALRRAGYAVDALRGRAYGAVDAATYRPGRAPRTGARYAAARAAAAVTYGAATVVWAAYRAARRAR
jgi:hypothetical protein